MFILISATLAAAGLAFYAGDMAAALASFEREHDRPD